MEKKRFILVPQNKNSMWTVKDIDSGVSIDFREGLFNETQKVNTPDNLSEEQVMKMPTTLREIGDWMAEDCAEVVSCKPGARCRAIWKLDNEKYWLAIADAMKSLLIEVENWAGNEASLLLAEVEDYLSLENGQQLNEMEQCNLLGSLSLLSNTEAWEVINLVYTFWAHSELIDTATWARDLLWWPAWCPVDLRESEDEDDGEVDIDIEDGGDDDPLDGVDFK